MFIIATVGPHANAETVRKIILSGANILRYNFAYRTPDEIAGNMKTAVDLIDDFNSKAKLMVDLPTNKIKLGDFDSFFFPVHEGDEVVFRSASYSPDCKEFIPVNLDKIGHKVKTDQIITLSDGEIAVQIIEIINDNAVRARICNNGVIQAVKNFNLDQTLSEEEILKKYTEILNKATEHNPYYVGISYINQSINEKIKMIPALKSVNNYQIIVAKIENQAGIDDFEEICKDKFYGMIMLDLGELGVNVPFEKLGVYKKKLVAIAKKHKKQIIVSTQILESTINNYIPYRSEIYGLTSMVLDGIDGIMLCHETASGQRPAYTMSVAKRIIAEAEKYQKELEK